MIVDSNILGLPYAFMHIGWAANTLLTVVIALTFLYMLLIHTHHYLNLDHGFSKIISFGDLNLTIANLSYRATIGAMIILSQVDFCIGYLIFISNTPAYLFHLLSNPSPFLALEALTPLAPLGIFANIINLGTMVNVVDLSAMSIILDKVLIIFLVHSHPLRTYLHRPLRPPLRHRHRQLHLRGHRNGPLLDAEVTNKAKIGKTLEFSMFFITFIYVHGEMMRDEVEG